MVAAGRAGPQASRWSPADRGTVSRVDQVHAGPDHVGQAGAEAGQRGGDDLEAAVGLDLDIVGAGAVRPDGPGPRDQASVPYPYPPTEGNGVLER